METIRVYDHDSDEYTRLEMACIALNRFARKGTRYHISDTYFDYGQGWRWTTIIATKPDGSHYQALNPRDHARIITAPDTLAMVREIVADRYWIEC